MTLVNPVRGEIRPGDMVRDFEELQRHALTGGGRRRCAVPGAADAHALEAVFLAQRRGYVTPVLIGESMEIRSLIDDLGFADEAHTIVECPPTRNPAEVAIELIRQGQADFILKGRMQTRDLLKPLLNKDHRAQRQRVHHPFRAHADRPTTTSCSP